MNAPLQGSAADLVKMAMIAVDTQLADQHLDAAMLLQVHDELVLEVAQDAVDVVYPLVRNAMEGVMSLRVPLHVSAAWGPNWATMSAPDASASGA